LSRGSCNEANRSLALTCRALRSETATSRKQLQPSSSGMTGNADRHRRRCGSDGQRQLGSLASCASRARMLTVISAVGWFELRASCLCLLWQALFAELRTGERVRIGWINAMGAVNVGGIIKSARSRRPSTSSAEADTSPGWPIEPGRTCGRGLIQIITGCYVRGVSARRADGSVRTSGLERMSESLVS